MPFKAHLSFNIEYIITRINNVFNKKIPYFHYVTVVKGAGGLSSIGDIIASISLAFPNLSSAIAGVTAAFSSGAGVMGTFGAAASGLFGIIAAHPFLALAAGVAVAVGLFDVFTESAKEAEEKMENSISNYEAAKAKVEEVNTEIEKTQQAIDQLQNKKSLTFVEQAELDRLKGVTEQLQIQKDLAEKEEARAAKQAAKDILNSYKKNFTDKPISHDAIQEHINYANALGNNAALFYDENDLSAYIAGIKQMEKLRDEAAKSGDTSEVERYNQIISDGNDVIWEQVSILSEYKDKLSAIPVSEMTTEQKDALKSISDSIEVVYKELDPAKWQQIQFDKIFNNSELASAKQELVEMAQATDNVGITVDDVKSKYPELASAVEAAGFSLQDLVDNINSEAEVLDMDSVVKNIKEAFEKDLESQTLEPELEIDPKVNEEKKDEFNDWIDNELDAEDQQRVYHISVEYDTSGWTIDDWKGKLNEEKEAATEAGQAIKDFASIMADTSDGGFKDSLDKEITKLNTLKDALSKFNSGDLSESDVYSLITGGFPDLINYTDNLGVGLQKLMSDIIGTSGAAGNATGIMALFDSQIEALGDDTESVEQMRTLRDSIIEMYSAANGADISSTTSSVNALVSNISTVQSAINSQMNGKSVSIDFNAEGMSDYRSALEYVNGTMQLNAEKVREIAKAKAEEETAIIKTNKALEQEEYLKNARQIEAYREQLASKNFAEGESASTIQASINSLLAQNSAIADTCKQYDLLSSSIQEAISSYSNWLNAQSASDYGDMANDASSAIQRIRDTYSEDSDIFGNFGSKKFEAAVDFIVPDSVDHSDLSAIESYMADFQQYLTFDENGKQNGLNVDKFLENSVNAGLMSYSEDDGFQVLGGKKMEDFAKGLNMSSGMVQAMFDELQLKGAKFDWGDEAVKTIGDLAIEANQAAESLRGMDEFKDMKIKMDVSDLSTTAEQVSALDATIAEMDQVKATPGVDASAIDNANAVIQYCLTQKQLLSQPEVMRVDTSQVEGDMSNAISLLQQFQEAQNNLEIQQKVGADTSEAEAQVQSLTSEIQGLSPDIKASLSIDTTSTESIQSSIKGLTAEVMVKAGIDDSAIQGYNPDTKSCDVIYNPKTDALPTSFSDVSRNVNYVGVTSGLPTSFSTLTRYVHYVKTGDVQVNGTAHVGGTAHASGTAKAGGDWGTAEGGRTLVGELGREIVVDPRTGQWYTVGDNGAEFTDIPAGAIVFNHRQTEDLLAHGYVSGRASALVSGTAMVTGGYKPHQPSGRITSSSNSSQSSSHSNYHSPSSSGGSSGGHSSSSSSSSGGKKDDDFEESFDWVEIALKRITEAIDRIKVKADSVYKTVTKRNGALADEISLVNQKIDLQNKAYKKYIDEANSVGLSESWKKKVRDGSIDISTIKDKDLAEKIKKYQEWYEKALECKDAIAELHEEAASLYMDRFDNISDDFDNKISLLEHLTNTYNTGIDVLEAKGLMNSTKYYKALQNVEKKKQTALQQELTDLTEAFSQAMASGEIEKYSEKWYEMQNAINSVKEKLDESTLSVLEYQKALRELDWSYFDFMEDRISKINDESNFLIDLMSNGKLHDDKGNITNLGNATLGLHGQNYNVYMAQADQYAKEAKKISKQLAKDPYNTDLLKRREELLDLQRESIKNAEDEKQKIVDLVKEGIELQINAMNDLISKYTESLDSAKDLYEYQKKVKDQTSDIAKLQKQLSAYKNDTSEETRSTVQKLQVELSDAMETLQETEYDQYITDTKKLLDQLSSDYETFLNQRLDDVDALVSDVIDGINANSSDIMTTLREESANVGYSMSEALNTIWNNNGGANAIITRYGDNFLQQFTSVNAALKICSDYVAGLVAKANAEAAAQQAATQAQTQPNKPTTPSKPTTPTKPTKPTTPSKPTRSEKDNYGVALAIWNGNYGWGTGSTRVSRLKAKGFDANKVQSIVNKMGKEGYIRSGAWVGKYYGIKNLAPYHYNKYATGLKKANRSETAWVNELGAESIISPSKNAITTHINKGDSVLTADATKNIWDMANDPSSFIKGALFKSGSISGDNSASANNYNLDNINFNLPNVMNYAEFVTELQKDKKFEQMIQAMTLGRATGGSKLAKYKYKWS